MKTCNKCLTKQPKTEFYKKSTAKDGLFWWCRTCHKQYVKAKWHEAYQNSSFRAAEQTRIQAFYEQYPDKRKAWGKNYQTQNQAKINAYLKARYAGKLKRTPHWLTKDDEWLIEQAYELAKMRTELLGFQWHVDHIVPLQGRLVSGLHVPHNLQVIPATENRKKSNKFVTT